MVSLDFSFRSMLIEDIVEDYGVLCTEGSISCLGYYHGKRVEVFDDEFFSLRWFIVRDGVSSDGFLQRL